MKEAKPRIYAVTIDGKTAETNEEIRTMHCCYLDGDAEDINGYDICQGNIDALFYLSAINRGIHRATLVFADGTEKPCFMAIRYREESRDKYTLVWLESETELIKEFTQKYLR